MALGGWKNRRAILECYQQPREHNLREALARRSALRSARIAPRPDAGHTPAIPDQPENPTNHIPGHNQPVDPANQPSNSPRPPGDRPPDRPTADNRPGPQTPPPIDPGTPDFDANLRGSVFTPGDDARLGAAQGRTYATINRISAASPYSAQAVQGAERYRSIFGSGQVGAGSMNPTSPAAATCSPKTVDDMSLNRTAPSQPIRRPFPHGRCQADP